MVNELIRMTTYSFGPALYEYFSKLDVFRTPTRQEEAFEPARMFGFRIECDPTLPAGIAEIRGIKDGKPHVVRIRVSE